MEEQNDHSSSSTLEDKQLWKDILGGKVNDVTAPFSSGEENEMWVNILNGIRANERKKKLKRIRIYSTIAASIMFAVLSLIGYNTMIKPDVYLAELQNSEIKLSDGSVVNLYQGGKLTVEKSFAADTREVFLEGNAVFHVAKSKEHPFIVHGKGYETKVLGTVFKVTQEGKTFNVDLYEGKVLVYRKGHSKEPIVLMPLQTFSNLGIPQVASVSQTENIKSASKDKSAAFTFNECPLRDAVLVIEKTYGIKIYYPTELENTKITIRLPSTTAERFIQSLAIQLNLNIKQNNDSIFELEK
nr:FecR family protein [Pedobacter sp. ASV2]